MLSFKHLGKTKLVLVASLLQGILGLVLSPQVSAAQSIDHNDWTKDIAAQTGFEEFHFAFSNDNRRFATAIGPDYKQIDKGNAPKGIVRTFVANDGKSISPVIQTGQEQIQRLALSNDASLLAVGGYAEGKLRLELYDGITGTMSGTFKIDKSIESYSSRWCGLAFNNDGQLFACARVSSFGKSETSIHTFAVPELKPQGAPTLIAQGSSNTLQLDDGRIVGAVFDVGAKNSFQYVPARKEVAYLVDYCCDGGKWFEVASYDPVSKQVTSHRKVTYHNAQKDQVLGLSADGQNLIYLYYGLDKLRTDGNFDPSTTTVTGVDSQIRGVARGLTNIMHYFTEPGLIIDYSGRIRLRGQEGFFTFPGIGKIKGRIPNEWKHIHRAAFGFEPDSRKLVRLAYREWSTSRPLPPNFLLAAEHIDKATKLAEAGFKDVAISEIEASLKQDATFFSVQRELALDFWTKWNFAPADIGRWMLTSLNASVADTQSPGDAQRYMFFGLLAAANGHPAVALQVAQKIPKAFQPTKPSDQVFVPMYIALMEANAMATNGDLKGALGKLVQHREQLQSSSVRNWFYWYPELFSYIGRAEPRQLAYILGKQENELPKFPAPKTPAPFIDLNGKPISVGIGTSQTAPTPIKSTAPSSIPPVGKVLD